MLQPSQNKKEKRFQKIRIRMKTTRKNYMAKAILAAMIGLGIFNFLSFDDSFTGSDPSRYLEAAEINTDNQCAHELEALMKPLHQQWLYHNVPVLHDLVVVDSEYFAIFNVDGRISHGDREHYMDYAEDHEWFCDDQPGVVIGHDLPGYHTLIIKCKDVSQKITAKPTVRSKDGKQTDYNVEANINCVRTGPVMFPQHIKHASCTSIQGEVNRDLLLQWIEHHHLIGVDHFFVYVNEPFDGIDKLFPRPYVTYIPFDYHHRAFYYQSTWQNDCIYRAKNATLTWLGLHDIDEYWEPQEAPFNMDKVMETLNPDLDVGMTVANTWFGPHPNEDETFNTHYKSTNLLIDYIWRAPDHRGPQKFIVSPKLVDYFYVHWVTKAVEGSRPEQRFPWKIRMNHYRRPYTHVHSFDTEEEVKTLVRDASMRNRFKEGILDAMSLEK